MRQISRFDFALLIICSSVCFATVVQAQQGNKAAPRQVQAQVAPPGKPQLTRPVTPAAPAVVKPASAQERKPAAVVETADDELGPALEEILEKWEAASAKIKTIRGEQSRSEFNSVFSIEKVSKGPFFLEMPDKGRIDMLSVHVKQGTVSKRVAKDGTPYKVVAAEQSMKWICNGESILQLTEKKEENEKKAEKTYQRIEIPEDQRGANIVNTPLPFLLGIKAEEAKSRFQLKLKTENKDAALIYVTPRLEKDRQNYKMASIIIDKKRYLPIKVTMIDDTGLEIVYTFEGVEVNRKKTLAEKVFPDWESDPYRPNLKGWTLVVADDDPVEMPTTRTIPRSDPKRPSAETPPATSPPATSPRRTQPPNVTSPAQRTIR